MNSKFPGFFALLTLMVAEGAYPAEFEEDIIKTPQGDLKITFVGHGTLMLNFKGTIIHVDPWTQLADYSKLPKADLILITHEHRDHLDAKALALLSTDETTVILTKQCADQLGYGTVMRNGDTKTVQGVLIEAVPAYNIAHMREGNTPFHPRGAGNGYILTWAGKRLYIAGDTENTPEMKALTGIDIAFLPMNLPYTMTPEMVADAARAFKPKLLYPYHYGETDARQLTRLLADHREIEVRIRNMQ